MKPQPNQPETSDLFILPIGERGGILASNLAAGALANGRSARITQEKLEADGLVFRVLFVRLGKRPMEGEIASRMKQNMEAEWGTRIKNVNI